MKINNIIKRRPIILDGAMGTQLQKLGMPSDTCPEIWCLENKKIISSIHAEYSRFGSDVVYSSSFGANRIKLAQYGRKDVININKSLVQIAKKAVGTKALVAADIGPTGKFIEPFGNLRFEEAVDIFKEQIKGLILGGADLFVIETMIDIQEARAALIAVKELTNKFTIVTITYEKDLRTLNGTDPLTALITLQSLGADAVGCNCSSGPQDMIEIIKRIKPYSKVPLVAKPNAGIPKLVKGETIFSMKPKEFGSFGKELVLSGANMLGGCCGTSPEYIKELRKSAIKVKSVMPRCSALSAISSARRNIILDKCKLPVIIGECINPTGKKLLQQQLRQKKTTLIRSLAKEQELFGADSLDVNVGTSGIDEKRVLKNIIKLLSVATNAPLVIDSSNIEAVQTALRIYPGRALINSISGEKSKLNKLLKIAAKYGAMFILLPLNEKGVPKTFIKRKKIIQDVFKKAKELNLDKKDIIVDGLVMPVSSDNSAAAETLKTLLWARNIFKVHTTFGLSNVSFGMPQRALLNNVYLKLAVSKGLTTVIVNPFEKKKVESTKFSKLDIKKTKDVLLGKDKNAVKFLEHFSKKANSKLKSISTYTNKDITVYQAILNGNKEDIRLLIKKDLKSGKIAEDIVNKEMIPAIEKTGVLFDKREYFLPQLIASAQAMKTGFKYIKPLLEKENIKSVKKTVIILATVKGDVHDIGKNIVALMLENHGFCVIDLGKDVSAEKIIKEAKKHDNPIVGLSALMTTTMVNIKDVIKKANREKLNFRFLLGGAVVTPGYANSLGAQYANDGVEAVRVAKKISNP